jgi:hypothetical protein
MFYQVNELIGLLRMSAGKVAPETRLKRLFLGEKRRKPKGQCARSYHQSNLERKKNAI